MNKKIIFFDIDGTIYRYGKGFSKTVQQALGALQERGHLISLNTGRTRYFIPEEIQAMPWDGIVAGSGSHVECRGKVIYEKYVPETLAKTLIPALYQAGIAFTVETPNFVYLSGKMADRQLKIFEAASQNSQIKRIDSSKYQLRDTVRKFDFSEPVNKFSFLAKGSEELEFIKKSLGRQFYVLTENRAYFGYIYGEAVSAGCNKAAGMQILCGYLGMDMKDTVAFGDGMNDVDMVKAAGIGVLLGDADVSIHCHADHICERFEDGGICGGLRALGLLP